MRCACGSSGGAACGVGGLTAWGRGRRREGAGARAPARGSEGAEGVHVDYAHGPGWGIDAAVRMALAPPATPPPGPAGPGPV